MVYCGKASLGCQHCRTRRIKCDKVKPECSQCVRVGKKCPGYRDQLSLMFRDESSKVMQKAHASWGTSGSSNAAQPSSASSTAGSAVWSTPSPRSEGSKPRTPSRSPPSSAVSDSPGLQIIMTTIPAKVEPTVDQRGIQFFMDQYLMGQPDAPADSAHLQLYDGSSVAMQHVMVAVGLAGLSNVLGDRSMGILSRSKYTTALKATGQLIASSFTSKQSDPTTYAAPLTAAIMLALFEVVNGKGTKPSATAANIHMSGAVGLLRNVLPNCHMPEGARAVLQMIFSLFLASHLSDKDVPASFYECLQMCRTLLPETEHCVVDLAVSIANWLKMHAAAKYTSLRDGHPVTDNFIRQFMGMEALFAYSEEQLHAAWPYTEERGDFPPEAVFGGRYHKYREIWGARIWNHLRWARIMVCQDILKMCSDHPLSAYRVTSILQQGQYFHTVRRMAGDILASVPAHWHHPILPLETARKLAATSKGGSGAAGIPLLVWHVTIAGCAPGVPPEYWNWAYSTLQVIWKAMGMQHARALTEVMEAHRAGVEREVVEWSLKNEEEDWQGVDMKLPVMPVA